MSIEQRIGYSPYYRRFPRGPLIARAPTLPNPQTERLRVLLLTLYEPHFGHYKWGLRDALSKAALVWEWDYVNESGDFAAMADAWQPHLILTQFHDTAGVPEQLERARTHCPGAVVVNWNGDIYEEHLTTPAMLAMLRHVDLQLVVNADVLPVYEAAGIPAAYWQVAFEPVDESALPSVPPHDVVFLANAYSEERRKLGRFLRKLPYAVGLYGKGWPKPDGDTLYHFAAGRALYQNAKLVLSDNQYSGKGFVSNRLFEALASGTCVLQQRVDGLEDLTGLKAGVHYVEWNDERDLADLIATLLASDADRRRIGEAGRRMVLAHHSFEARVKQLFTELLPMAAERKQREPA